MLLSTAPLQTGRAINAHTDACGCDLLVMASRELAAHKRSLLGLFGVGSGARRGGGRGQPQGDAALPTQQVSRITECALLISLLISRPAQ